MTEEQAIAEATIKALEWFHPAHDFTQNSPGLTRQHIEFILKEVADGNVTGGKANRYIGWAQGVLCIEGFISLEQARDLNRDAIESVK